jgi:hypothetical protein
MNEIPGMSTASNKWVVCAAGVPVGSGDYAEVPAGG